MKIKPWYTIEEQEYPSVLKALEEQKILCIEPVGEEFEVFEECDHYFSVRLTREQLRAMGKEIIMLSRKKRLDKQTIF